jgi:uncharacterized protein
MYMPIFFKITAPNGQVSHLFGTFHGTDPKITQVPMEIKQAFDSAKQCIFESDQTISPSKRLQIREMVVESFKKWEITRKNAGDAFEKYQTHALDYCREVSGLTDKPEIWEKAKPAVVQNLQGTTPIVFTLNLLEDQNETQKYLIASAGKDRLDELLIKAAIQKNKPTHSLETADITNNAFHGFALSFQEQLEFYYFAQTLLQKGLEKSSLAKVQQLYLQGDTKGVLAYSHPCMHENAPEAVKKYYKTLITQRDMNFVNNMIPFLEQGDSFVAIGATHLDGVINELLAKGYTVDPVSLGNQYVPIYTPQMSLGLFGFHPSAAETMRKLDPGVKIEQTTQGLIAKFDDFKVFPEVKTIISLPADTTSTIATDLRTLGSLLEKHKVDIGFFRTPEIRYSGPTSKMQEYMQTHGQGYDLS